jgi:hypothetical protein
MLIILIHKLKEHLNYHPINEGLLYSLLIDKLNLKRTKDKSKIEKLNKLLEVINSNNSLFELLNSLKKLKRELSNNYAIQSVIRQVCKNFKSYRNAYNEYLKNPNKFNGTPKPPKLRKLKNIGKFTVELNKLSFKVIDGILQIKLHKNKKIKLKLPKLRKLIKKKKIFDNLNSNIIMKKLCNPIKNNIFKFCDLVLNKATPRAVPYNGTVGRMDCPIIIRERVLMMKVFRIYRM